MVFCNMDELKIDGITIKVTILILIDGFLQFHALIICVTPSGHNPYFNRWFSAIKKAIWILWKN